MYECAFGSYSYVHSKHTCNVPDVITFNDKATYIYYNISSCIGDRADKIDGLEVFQCSLIDDEQHTYINTQLHICRRAATIKDGSRKREEERERRVRAPSHECGEVGAYKR